MLIRKMIELITPVACLSCGQEGAVVCTTCLDIVPIREERCYWCNRASAGGKLCEQCDEQVLRGVVVAARYEGVVKDLIWSLKFQRSRSAAGAAAWLVWRVMADRCDFDVVTAVPVASGRYRERGYNQAELIGREVAKRLGLPYRSLLERTTTEHQLGRGRTERLEQIQGSFYWIRALRGERVLVVDDVITTGATLAECAVTLRAAGAGEVWGAAVARK